MFQYKGINADGNTELEHYRSIAATCLRVDTFVAENRHTGGILSRFIKGLFSWAARFFYWLNDDSSIDVYPTGRPT